MRSYYRGCRFRWWALCRRLHTVATIAANREFIVVVSYGMVGVLPGMDTLLLQKYPTSPTGWT